MTRGRHSYLANAAMDRQARYEAKGQSKGPLTWRPFQLAYMSAGT